jgi:hypothetical protein
LIIAKLQALIVAVPETVLNIVLIAGDGSLRSSPLLWLAAWILLAVRSAS